MAVFDAEGIVLAVGDQVEFQVLEDGASRYGIGQVLALDLEGLALVSEAGNGGAEGWIAGDLLRLRED